MNSKDHDTHGQMALVNGRIVLPDHVVADTTLVIDAATSPARLTLPTWARHRPR